MIYPYVFQFAMSVTYLNLFVTYLNLRPSTNISGGN